MKRKHKREKYKKKKKKKYKQHEFICNVNIKIIRLDSSTPTSVYFHINVMQCNEIYLS